MPFQTKILVIVLCIIASLEAGGAPFARSDELERWGQATPSGQPTPDPFTGRGSESPKWHPTELDQRSRGEIPDPFAQK